MLHKDQTSEITTSSGADRVVVEEPLTLVVNGKHSVVLMRMPGYEKELALGFLKGEGIIRQLDDVETISRCEEGGLDDANTIRLSLAESAAPEKLSRLAEVRSSCGVCGAEILEKLAHEKPEFPADVFISRKLLASMPEEMRKRQPVFTETGGAHAAAIFHAGGGLIVCREDIGRHNAFDKAIGHCILAGIETGDKVAVLSGRVSYEMTLKAIRAPFPIVAAVSAPTSLAVELAERAGITLACFVRNGSLRVYTHGERIT
ncbi:MAG: formate dehydrogenase accessory sulfurtransferase FdhD [Planctomycetota bacterium]